MDATLSISIALCTHNGGRFIAQQVASILRQTLPPLEIVLSDDASSDDTVSIVTRAVEAHNEGSKATRVGLVVIRNPSPLGVTRNFAQAMATCSGELIALSDQDDVWADDRLEVIAAVFGTRPSLLLLHGEARLIDAEGRPLPGTLLSTLGVGPKIREAIHDGHAFEQLMRRNLVTGATTVVRSELVRRARPFPESWVHDEWLGIIAAATGELDVIEAPLIGYRQHGSNQIGVRSLSPSGKARRLLEQGVQRNRQLLSRAQALAERLDEYPGIAHDRVVAAKEKLDHELVRSGLAKPRVLRELRSGRYRDYGNGLADAARDLIQPLDGTR